MKARWVAVGVAMLMLNTMPAAAGMMMGRGHRETAQAGRGGESGCPPMAGGVVPFGDERPWISFALAHAKDLELTPDQAKALATIRDEYQREAARLATEIRAAEGELEALYGRKPVELGGVEKLVRTITNLEADQRLARLRAVERGRQLLTPDQAAKLGEIARAMAGMHGASVPGAPGREH